MELDLVKSFKCAAERFPKKLGEIVAQELHPEREPTAK